MPESIPVGDTVAAFEELVARLQAIEIRKNFLCRRR
jgi:hypothetical protein